MEPNHNTEYAPGTELPQLEQADASPYGNGQTPDAPEMRSQQSPMPALGGTTNSPLTPLPTIPLAQNMPPPSSTGGGTAATTVTLTADDADLIEKEWVLKAKAIVMQTKNDPRAQNLQMNGVKADYLKKRYNKDLKASEN